MPDLYQQIAALVPENFRAEFLHVLAKGECSAGFADHLETPAGADMKKARCYSPTRRRRCNPCCGGSAMRNYPARLARYTGILDLLRGFKRGSGDYCKCLCPVHEADDRPHNPSMAVWPGNDGRLLFGCFAGCRKVDILAALGISWRDTMPDTGKEIRTERRIVARYDYRDEKGQMLYQTIRYQPKDFRQRRPGPGGVWIYDLTGVRRVLYRLPEIIASGPDVHVIVAEGEKDCETARLIGLLATTNVCGSHAPWLNEYSEALSGRHCIVIPDNDAPGLRHAAMVAGSLMLHDAASVRMASVPEGKDLTDFVDYLRRKGIRRKDDLRRSVVAALSLSTQWKPARRHSIPRMV